MLGQVLSFGERSVVTAVRSMEAQGRPSITEDDVDDWLWARREASGLFSGPVPRLSSRRDVRSLVAAGRVRIDHRGSLSVVGPSSPSGEEGLVALPRPRRGQEAPAAPSDVLGS